MADSPFQPTPPGSPFQPTPTGSPFTKPKVTIAPAPSSGAVSPRVRVASPPKAPRIKVKQAPAPAAPPPSIVETPIAPSATTALIHPQDVAKGISDITPGMAPLKPSQFTQPGVAELQKELRSLGYTHIQVTGIYGPATDAALKHYQAATGPDWTGPKLPSLEPHAGGNILNAPSESQIASADVGFNNDPALQKYLSQGSNDSPLQTLPLGHYAVVAPVDVVGQAITKTFLPNLAKSPDPSIPQFWYEKGRVKGPGGTWLLPEEFARLPKTVQEDVHTWDINHPVADPGVLIGPNNLTTFLGYQIAQFTINSPGGGVYFAEHPEQFTKQILSTFGQGLFDYKNPAMMLLNWSMVAAGASGLGLRIHSGLRAAAAGAGWKDAFLQKGYQGGSFLHLPRMPDRYLTLPNGEKVRLLESQAPVWRAIQAAYDKVLQRGLDVNPEGRVGTHAMKRARGYQISARRIESGYDMVLANRLSREMTRGWKKLPDFLPSSVLDALHKLQPWEQRVFDLTANNHMPEERIQLVQDALANAVDLKPEEEALHLQELAKLDMIAASGILSRVPIGPPHELTPQELAADPQWMAAKQAGDQAAMDARQKLLELGPQQVVVNPELAPRLARVDALVAQAEILQDKINLATKQMNQQGIRTRIDNPGKVLRGGIYDTWANHAARDLAANPKRQQIANTMMQDLMKYYKPERAKLEVDKFLEMGDALGHYMAGLAGDPAHPGVWWDLHNQMIDMRVGVTPIHDLLTQLRTKVAAEFKGLPKRTDILPDMRHPTATMNVIHRMAQFGAEYRKWYDTAAAQVLYAWEDLRKQGYPIDRATFLKVVARMSQSANPTVNIQAAVRAVKTFYDDGYAHDTGHRFPNQSEPVVTEIMQGKEWSGLKTNDFYGNLLKHVDPAAYKKEFPGINVTIDRHAAQTIHQVSNPSPPQYLEAAKLVEKVAKRIGWAPEEVQAAMWVPQRAASMRGSVLERGKTAKPIGEYMASAGTGFERGIKNLIDRGELTGESPIYFQERRPADYGGLSHEQFLQVAKTEINTAQHWADIEALKRELFDREQELASEFTGETVTPRDYVEVMSRLLETPGELGDMARELDALHRQLFFKQMNLGYGSRNRAQLEEIQNLPEAGPTWRPELSRLSSHSDPEVAKAAKEAISWLDRGQDPGNIAAYLEAVDQRLGTDHFGKVIDQLGGGIMDSIAREAAPKPSPRQSWVDNPDGYLPSTFPNLHPDDEAFYRKEMQDAWDSGNRTRAIEIMREYKDAREQALNTAAELKAKSDIGRLPTTEPNAGLSAADKALLDDILNANPDDFRMGQHGMFSPHLGGSLEAPSAYGIKGAIRFGPHGADVFRNENTDLSTYVHEFLGHLTLEKGKLPESMMIRIIRAAGIKPEYASKVHYEVNEPPIPVGYTRLYRGGPKGTNVESAGYVDYTKGGGSPGRGTWFSPDRQYAQQYVRGGELKYVDVPSHMLENASAKNEHGVTEFVKGKEIILPKEIAAQARTLSRDVVKGVRERAASKRTNVQMVTDRRTGELKPRVTHTGRIIANRKTKLSDLTVNERKQVHEYFARQVELWVHQGRTTNPALKGAMRSLARGMQDVYENQELTDEHGRVLTLHPGTARELDRLFGHGPPSGSAIVGGEDPLLPGRGMSPANIFTKGGNPASPRKMLGVTIGKGQEPLVTQPYSGAGLKTSRLPERPALLLANRLKANVRYMEKLKALGGLLRFGTDLRPETDHPERYVLVNTGEFEHPTVPTFAKEDAGVLHSTMESEEAMGLFHQWHAKLVVTPKNFADFFSGEQAAAFKRAFQEGTAVKGYKWVDRNLIGSDLTQAAEAGRGGVGMQIVDAMTNFEKNMIVYLKPGHFATRFMANAGFNLMHGALRPDNMILSADWWFWKMDPMERARALAIAGQGYSQALAGEERGLGTHLAHSGAHFYATWVDSPSRFLALVQEARRAGYDSWEKFQELLNSSDPKVVADRNHIGIRANRESGDYARLGPKEQRVVRRWIFFYPWLKTSTFFAGRLLYEHPIKTGLLLNTGAVGQQWAQQRLGKTDIADEGLIPFGSGKNFKTSQPSGLSPFATPAEAFNTIAAFTGGIPNVSADSAAGWLGPVPKAIADAAFNLNSFGEANPPGVSGLDVLYNDFFSGTPPYILGKAIAANQTAGDQPTKQFPVTPLSQLLRFGAGSWFPRATNKDAMNYQGYKEQAAFERNNFVIDQYNLEHQVSQVEAYVGHKIDIPPIVIQELQLRDQMMSKMKNGMDVGHRAIIAAEVFAEHTGNTRVVPAAIALQHDPVRAAALYKEIRTYAYGNYLRFKREVGHYIARINELKAQQQAGVGT